MSTMKIKLPLVSSLLFLTLLVSSENMLCQAQPEWSTTYKINVHTNGSASWIIERRTLLTQGDTWSIFRYSSIEHMQEFSNNMSTLVNKAWLKTGREMEIKAESLKITATTSQTETGSYGIVKYQFDWLNFTEVRDTQIILGDTFVEGIFLFGDGGLIVKYPSEYDVADVSPQPDIKEYNQTLTWYRIGNFEIGKPKVILEQRTLGTMYFLQKYASAIIGTIVFIGIASAGLWFFKFRKKEKVEVSGLVPRVPLGIEDEEEKVVKLLRVAGGSLYQSAITKELGFSRSKTSKLLTEMENKGKLVRKKKGREKLVTLRGEVVKNKKLREQKSNFA